MLTKLLVPLDGTPQAAAALPLARTLATAAGATVVLLRVVPDFQGEEQVRQAKTYLARVRRELVAPTVDVEVAVRFGDPSAEIVHEVHAQQADLVILATHGRVGLPRALLGSVAQDVLARSRVPLLLLKAGGRRVTRITTLLVPVDGSPGSSLALEAAVTLARLTGASVRLLQAVAFVPGSEYVVRDGKEFGPAALVGQDWGEADRVRAQDHVDGLTRRLSEAGVQAVGEARVGSAARAIVAAADEASADLIVMSTHARTGPTRAVLGSVADEVVRTAHRPVLLVRQGAAKAVLQTSSLSPTAADT